MVAFYWGTEAEHNGCAGFANALRGVVDPLSLSDDWTKERVSGSESDSTPTLISI